MSRRDEGEGPRGEVAITKLSMLNRSMTRHCERRKFEDRGQESPAPSA